MRVNLTDSDREDLFKYLLEVSSQRKLPPGTVTSVAGQYGVSRQVLYGIWITLNIECGFFT